MNDNGRFFIALVVLIVSVGFLVCVGIEWNDCGDKRCPPHMKPQMVDTFVNYQCLCVGEPIK